MEGLVQLQLQRGDVLVVATVSPEVAQATEQAGLIVIVLPDMRASPLVRPARHAFFILVHAQFDRS